MHSGEPPSTSASPAAACWSPAWAPACSSPCCRKSLRATTRLTGIEYDPVTARIARAIHPQARVLCEDYTRSLLAGGFDLAIGNPPFADRIVRADPTTAGLGLRLHDYFIARSIARLRPGGLALFVTSTGTMDKGSTVAREHIAGMADLIGAVRLPEGSMRATAGTDVVVDVLVFQRRAEGRAPGGKPWIDLAEIPVEGPVTRTKDTAEQTADADAPHAEVSEGSALTEVINQYFVAHPEMVLGTHAMRRGIYGPQLAYTCRPRPGDPPLEDLLNAALSRLPANIFTATAAAAVDEAEDTIAIRAGTAAEGATIKEGSYLIGPGGRLMQIVDGAAETVAVREGQGQPTAFHRARPRSSVACCRSATPCARCCAPRPPIALGGAAGQAAHRLRQLRPVLRADQPHQCLCRHRRGDRRGARDASPAEPRPVRRRSRLLAGRHHRGL